MTDNPIRDVTCAECGASLRRRPINPNTKRPIARFYCGLSCKAEYQRRARPIGKGDLRAMYEGGMSANDIAKKVGRNAKRVWEWLRDDGIATRPRGHVKEQHFKPGHKLCVGREISDEHRNKLRQARAKDGSKGLFRPDGQHVLKGRCGPDHPRWMGGSTPERQAFYASDEWKVACVAVWRRADAKCERCGLDHRTVNRAETAFHVHHVASFSTFPALRADPDNLRLLCAPCHRWVHSRANEEKEMIA